MDTIKLSERLSFGIESYSGGLRLIVFDKGEEWVCHKSRLKHFKGFMLAEYAHLFKGRLQMDKTKNQVAVKVKGNLSGIIAFPDLEKLFHRALETNIVNI